MTEKQRQLSQTLASVKAYQKDLDALLTRLERAAPDRRNLQGDGLRREKAYRIAEAVEAEITQLSSQLDETLQSLNEVQEKALDPQHPLAAVVKVLNAQVATLQWVASTTDEVETDVQDALAAVTASKNRPTNRTSQFG